MSSPKTCSSRTHTSCENGGYSASGHRPGGVLAPDECASVSPVRDMQARRLVIVLRPCIVQLEFISCRGSMEDRGSGTFARRGACLSPLTRAILVALCIPSAASCDRASLLRMWDTGTQHVVHAHSLRHVPAACRDSRNQAPLNGRWKKAAAVCGSLTISLRKFWVRQIGPRTRGRTAVLVCMLYQSRGGVPPPWEEEEPHYGA